MYQVVLKKSAQKNLKKIDKRHKPRVIQLLFLLQRNPYIGKPLLGVLKGYYSLRCWPYRIIYTIYKKKIVVIIDIGHRQGVYKN